MTCSLLVLMLSGLLLWCRRHQAPERSRTFFGVLTVIMGLLLAFRIVKLLAGPEPGYYKELLSPVQQTGSCLMLFGLILYPLEIMRPRWINVRRALIFFWPCLFLVIPALLGVRYQRLYSLGDVWQNIGQFNVWWRMCYSLFFIYYVVGLRLLPYNWHQSSATHRWIDRYALSVLAMAVLYLVVTRTSSLASFVLWHIYVCYFIIYYTYYELFIRILPPPLVMESAGADTGADAAEPVADVEEAPVAGAGAAVPAADKPADAEAPEARLFRQIDERIDRERLYCNPDFGRDELCRLTGLSRARLGALLQQYTDASNSQVYINRKRIAYAAQLLADHPEYSIEAISFDCGLRVRTTFYRLFKDTYGMAPAEYRRRHLMENNKM